MVENSKSLSSQVDLLYLGILLLILSTMLAIRWGFYTYPKGNPSRTSSLSFRDVLGAFTTFLIIQIIVVPFGAYIVLSIFSGSWGISDKNLSVLEQGWINLSGIVAAALGLWCYCFLVEPTTPPIIAGENGFRNFDRKTRDFLMGSLAWAISFPVVFAIGQVASILVTLIFNPAHIDQVAVRHLKMTYSNPPLFFTTILILATIVPLLEETIFRGFLQNWLKRHFSPTVAIAITSAIFAMFHFSTTQGWHNIDLIISLFILSCYLGFIYERQRSIWASVGLHATFNLFSIILIVGGTK